MSNQSKYKEQFNITIFATHDPEIQSNPEKRFQVEEGASLTRVNLTRDGNGNKIIKGHPLYNLVNEIDNYTFLKQKSGLHTLIR